MKYFIIIILIILSSCKDTNDSDSGNITLTIDILTENLSTINTRYIRNTSYLSGVIYSEDVRHELEIDLNGLDISIENLTLDSSEKDNECRLMLFTHDYNGVMNKVYTYRFTLTENSQQNLEVHLDHMNQ